MDETCAARSVLVREADADRASANTACRSSRSQALSTAAAQWLGVEEHHWQLPGSRGGGSDAYALREARRKISQLERDAAGQQKCDQEDAGFVFNAGGGRVAGQVARTLKVGDAVWCLRSLPFGAHHSLTYVKAIERMQGAKGYSVALASGTRFTTKEAQVEMHISPVDLADQVLYLVAGLVQPSVASAWVCRLLKRLATMRVLCGECLTGQRVTTCSLVLGADGTPETLHGFRRWKCQRCFGKKKKWCRQGQLHVRAQAALQARGALAPVDSSVLLKAEYVEKPPWRRMGRDLPTAASDPVPAASLGCKPKKVAKPPATRGAAGYYQEQRVEQQEDLPNALLKKLEASDVAQIAETLKMNAAARAVVDAAVLAPLSARVSLDPVPALLSCGQFLEELEVCLQQQPILAKLARAVVNSPAAFVSAPTTGAFFDNTAAGVETLERVAEERSVLADTVLADLAEPQPSVGAPAIPWGHFDDDSDYDIVDTWVPPVPALKRQKVSGEGSAFSVCGRVMACSRDGD